MRMCTALPCCYPSLSRPVTSALLPSFSRRPTTPKRQLVRGSHAIVTELPGRHLLHPNGGHHARPASTCLRARTADNAHFPITGYRPNTPQNSKGFHLWRLKVADWSLHSDVTRREPSWRPALRSTIAGTIPVSNANCPVVAATSWARNALVPPACWLLVRRRNASGHRTSRPHACCVLALTEAWGRRLGDHQVDHCCHCPHRCRRLRHRPTVGAMVVVSAGVLGTGASGLAQA